MTDAADQTAHRKAKLDRLRENGADPLPARFDQNAEAAAVHDRFDALAPGEQTDHEVRVAGRLVHVRRQGGLSFADLADRTGTVQLFVDTRRVGPDVHRAFDGLDLGDWVGVTGTVMKTRRGELSVAVAGFDLLGKALRPLPEAHTGLTDTETRYRQRYVDLAVNDRTRRIFGIRRATVRAIRDELTDRGFWEVEGPVLQTVQGGAAARPFITHHNALGIDLYLRIALELHLKRLVVGGLEKVFEIGRVFRNEGVDTRHNPEFTMLEAYQAYADYRDMMDLVEALVTRAAREALGAPDKLVVSYGGQEIDLTPPWPRVRMADLLQEHTGAEMSPLMPVDDARALLAERGVAFERDWGSGRLMKELYDEKIQHEVTGPLFCLDYPAEVSPLARAHRSDPGYVERFELIVAGFELCNAYSEQNDPGRQLAAFEEEARAKAGGDPEAGDVDVDYVRALEYGMPCTGGLGIGIDRLVMLIAGVTSIREVILFPTLRPEFGGATPPTGPDLPRGGAGVPAGSAGAAAGGVAAGSGSAAAGGGGAVAGGAAVVGASTGAGPAGRALAVVPSGPSAPSGDPTLARRDPVVRTLAVLTAVGGLLALLSLLPGLASLLPGVDEDFVPLGARVTGHVVTLIIGLALLVLADQVARRKRTAWRITVVLFGAATVVHLLKGPHPVAAAYCAAVTVALVLARGRFQAPPDPPSLLRLLRLGPLYVVAVFLFGHISLLVERDHLSPDLTFLGGLRTILAGLVGIGGAYTYERHFFADFFPAALLTLGVLGILGLVVALFRPVRSRRPHTVGDWEHAERLVHSYGWDTLAYFALRDDKNFFFSSDGEAMIAYTYLGGHALASGDPVGAPASVPLVLDEFLAMCTRLAWTPAFLAVRSADAPLYTARGFRTFYLGDEAILRCDTFSLDGSERKGVRAAVRRVGRTHSFRLMGEADASAQLVGQLNAISEQWRGKAPERGFTMALSQDVRGEGHNAEFLLCVAFDADGRPGGFLRVIPAYGPDPGYTLDLMRHAQDAPNGMTEFLLASTATELAGRGVRRLSMNFAAFGRLFSPDVHYSPSQRIARRLVEALNPFFQVKTLHDFNAKFGPQWLPRALAYQGSADLPRVGLLYAGAEGFLSVPGIGDLLVPKAVGGVTSPSAPGGGPAAGASRPAA